MSVHSPQHLPLKFTSGQLKSKESDVVLEEVEGEFREGHVRSPGVGEAAVAAHVVMPSPPSSYICTCSMMCSETVMSLGCAMFSVYERINKL
jgi:hypothetical protein